MSAGHLREFKTSRLERENMPQQSIQDERTFRNLLRRNVALPFGVGIATAAVFVLLICYLLNAMSWVEHSERVIGDANDLAKLSVDRETGLRGFLLSEDESFLAPYTFGRTQFQDEITSLEGLVSDNPPQVERLKRIQALQTQWDSIADEMIRLRREGGDYVSVVKSGRGKLEFDETRREFNAFMSVEMGLRQERTTSARTVTTLTVAIFLGISLTLSVLLALFWTARADKDIGHLWRRIGSTRAAKRAASSASVAAPGPNASCGSCRWKTDTGAGRSSVPRFFSGIHRRSCCRALRAW